jgi:DivIVA domain-containing protein
MDEFEELESDEAFRWPRGNSPERTRMVEELLQVQFPQAVRGYEREAVDGYIERVRAVISELEAASSPDAAVQRAIEEISDETREVLLRAQQSAQEITTRARDRSDALLEKTERETTETRDTADRETTELRATSRREAEELWNAAQREVSELRATAQREVEELWATAQQEAAQLRATARQETDQLIAAAENRVRELDDSAERLLAERKRLLGDMEAVSRQLASIADAEAGRFPDPAVPDAPAELPSNRVPQ